MGHCAILGLVELCYLSERMYPVIALEYNPTTADCWKLQAGTGYLNNWNFADKETGTPPSDRGSGVDTKYVNEK